MDPRLALDRLDDDGRRLDVNRAGDRLRVVTRTRGEARHEWRERRLLGLLRRRGQRAVVLEDGFHGVPP